MLAFIPSWDESTSKPCGQMARGLAALWAVTFMLEAWLSESEIKKSKLSTLDLLALAPMKNAAASEM